MSIGVNPTKTADSSSKIPDKFKIVNMCLTSVKSEKESLDNTKASKNQSSGTSEGKSNIETNCSGISDIGNNRNVKIQCGSVTEGKGSSKVNEGVFNYTTGKVVEALEACEKISSCCLLQMEKVLKMLHVECVICNKISECNPSETKLLADLSSIASHSEEKIHNEDSAEDYSKKVSHPITSSRNSFGECTQCCADNDCQAKQFFNRMKSNPESFIERYRKNQGTKTIPGDDDFNQLLKASSFLLTKTHGEASLGDKKYHYLMVDGCTSISSDIDHKGVNFTVQAGPDSDKQAKEVSKPKGSIKEEPPIENAQWKLPTQIKKEKHDEEGMIPQEVTKPKRSIKEEPPIENVQLKQPTQIKKEKHDEEGIIPQSESSTNKPESASQETPADTDTVKRTPVPKANKTVSPMEEEFHDQEVQCKEESREESDIPKNSIDLHLEDDAVSSGRRISISWTKDVEPNVENKKEEENRPDMSTRRLSTVSWRSIEEKEEIPNKTEEPNPRKYAKTSLLDQILKLEKLKNLPRRNTLLVPSDEGSTSKETDIRHSIVVPTQTEPQSKKCCGLFRKKKQKTGRSSIKSRMSKVSKSGKTLNTMRTLDSDSSDSEDLSIGIEGDNDSRRSSTDSYQKRKLSISNPVSEKNKTINTYLSNIH